MSQIKTLIVKEYWTHKKSMLTPAFIQGGIYAVILILVIIAFFNKSFSITTLQSEISGTGITHHNLIFWIIGFFSTALPGLLVIFTCGGVVGSIVNDDYRKNCILFHSSFPVSMMKRILSKFFVTISSTLAMVFLLSLFNIIIQMPFAIYLINDINIIHMIYYNLLGMTQAITLYFVSAVLIICLQWFFSAVYNEKTASKSASIIAALIAVSFIIAKLFNFLPQLMSFIHRIIRFFLPTISIHFDEILAENMQLRNLILQNWANFFSTETLLRLLFAFIFFAIGSFILYKREIN